jgi:hypothetical protein
MRGPPGARVLVPDEIRAFLDAGSKSNSRRQFKIDLRLIPLKMVRKSEVLLALREHVDLEGAGWHIPAEHAKAGEPYIVFLARQAVALFGERRVLAGGSERGVPVRGTLTPPFAHNATDNALKTALRGQDIPILTIHDLRCTTSVLLHENGWPSDVVAKAPTHTIVRTRVRPGRANGPMRCGPRARGRARSAPVRRARRWRAVYVGHGDGRGTEPRCRRPEAERTEDANDPRPNISTDRCRHRRDRAVVNPFRTRGS